MGRHLFWNPTLWEEAKKKFLDNTEKLCKTCKRKEICKMKVEWEPHKDLEDYDIHDEYHCDEIEDIIGYYPEYQQ